MRLLGSRPHFISTLSTCFGRHPKKYEATYTQALQESYLHAPYWAGTSVLTITATARPSRILRASCRELKRLSSLRSRSNLGLRSGPNLWLAAPANLAWIDGCRPPLSKNISCLFRYTSRQIPVRCREMLSPPFSSRDMRPSSHQMPFVPHLSRGLSR